MRTYDLLRVTALCAAAVVAPVVAQTPTSANEIAAAYAAQASQPPSAERGQALFNRRFGREFDSCAACHGAKPTTPGKDIVTEKTIAPLAPAARPGGFADKAKVDYRFSMNCKDVVGRDCSVQEKADVMAWLVSLKP